MKSSQDFIAYHVSDSSPVDKHAPQGYSERYIHGEVYRKHEGAKCVVHSHSEVVIPFTLGGVEVRPVFHMAGFLGPEAVRVFDIAETYAGMEGNYEADMLIKSQYLGSALASTLSHSRPVVLQHKHGFTTLGTSVEQAVYRAIYTQMNCKLLAQAFAFAGNDAGKITYLTKEEARACSVMNEKCQDKSWRLWLREVQVNPLYETEEGEPAKGKVAGMKM
jgi:ribulose-5-phosphate 4-epimerase/fuculose-1-phosphate aldolase